MGECYPPDYTGPLPPGGYYCSPNVPTVFGSINSILQQAASTAAQIRSALNQYQGKTVPPPATTPVSSGTATLGILLGAVVVGLVIFLIWRELK